MQPRAILLVDLSLVDLVAHIPRDTSAVGWSDDLSKLLELQWRDAAQATTG